MMSTNQEKKTCMVGFMVWTFGLGAFSFGTYLIGMYDEFHTRERYETPHVWLKGSLRDKAAFRKVHAIDSPAFPTVWFSSRWYVNFLVWQNHTCAEICYQHRTRNFIMCRTSHRCSSSTPIQRKKKKFNTHLSSLPKKKKEVIYLLFTKEYCTWDTPNQDSRHDIGKIIYNKRQVRNCLEFCCSIRKWNIQILTPNDQII